MLTRLRAERPTIYGAVMIVMGMVIIAFIDNLVRAIAEDIGLWQFHAVRTAMAVPLLLVFARFAGTRLWPENCLRVALRTGLITTSMLLYFASLPMMPITQVAAGLFTAPIFVLLFSAVLFRQRIGIWRIFAVGVGFAGVVTILRPDAAGFESTLLMPVLAGAFYALSTITTRQWCASEGTAVLLLAFFLAIGLAGVIGALVLAVFPAPEALVARASFIFAPWSAPTLSTWGLMAVQAVASLIAVAALTRGYQSAETSYITVFEYSFLIMATFWGWFLWGDAPQIGDAIGIAIIIGAGAVIAVRGAMSQAAASV